ncbi:conserved hypothetical protein [Microsporum canis CBS 113480]|uniref:Aminoglycoside phosphotransferase domain-containing protein n=1 Tax=Arthroderma otae (strain ATCC MYA-4605 / CBS 113480) TaxID=554155 RepID=C5FSK9_ARTOC|nr:conserved hypothetical protein [Microsporum canis CBS 113480]EEQ32862.1 conserved hypothetical protein [Microsporum canis CBS 113480]
MRKKRGKRVGDVGKAPSRRFFSFGGDTSVPRHKFLPKPPYSFIIVNVSHGIDNGICPVKTIPCEYFFIIAPKLYQARAASLQKDADLQWIQFVLTHPDLNIQNVLVSEDGSAQGLIDWGGVAAVPRLVGRDWDPAIYVWNKEMEEGIERDTLGEDSPETLCLQRYLSLQRHSLFLCTSTAQESSVTLKSLFVENLLIVAENSLCRYEIITKFVEKIVELARVKSPDHISNKYGDLKLFEITDILEDGDMELEMLEFLRIGFNSLLDQSSVRIIFPPENSIVFVDLILYILYQHHPIISHQMIYCEWCVGRVGNYSLYLYKGCIHIALST